MPDPTTSAQRADAMIAWFRTYAARRLNSQLADERRTIPPYVLLDLGNQGFFGLMASEAHGGKALSYTDMARVFEQVGAVDLTLAMLLGLHNGLGMRAIQTYGQTELQAEWLPLLASGRQLIAFALSEPGAGSNPQAIQATATRVSGGWCLNAHKHWIGLGSWAGLLVVIARAVDAEGRSLRQIALAVPADHPALRVGEEARTMGIRGFVQNELWLEEAFIPDSHVLGKPGAGMLVAQDAMMLSRIGISSVCVGAMKRAAQLMARYASRRQVATGLLVDNAIALDSLNEATCAAEATAALIGRVTASLDAGASVSRAASLACKTTVPELLWETVDRLVQLLGGRGYIETNEVPRLMRDARVLRIFEGPTEPLTVALGGMAIARPQAIQELIGLDFQAPQLAAEVTATCASLAERYAALPFDSTAHRSQWSEYRAGELTTWAILHAASLGVTGPDTIRWTRARYDAACVAALAWEGPMPATSDLLARVLTFADSIGDVEQTLPGEADRLDPLLARDPG